MWTNVYGKHGKKLDPCQSQKIQIDLQGNTELGLLQ